MKGKVVIATGIISAVLLIFTIFNILMPTYGNDIDSINKIISESDIITQPISIVDVIDFAEYRIAGFVEGGESLGVVILKKDKNDNYKCQSIEKKKSSISAFNLPIFEEGKQGGIYGLDIIVSNNPDVAKVKRIINDKYIDEKEIKGVGLILMEIDISESEIQESIYYYDIDGNRL